MMTMVRDRGYGELLRQLGGRRVLVWTCDTCARLCGVAGTDRATDLASRLSSDGVEVVGVASSGACCLMGHAERMADGRDGYDLVLALCCEAGARNAAEATGCEVLNPIETVGPGYLGSDGVPRVLRRGCDPAGGVPLGDAAPGMGGPYRCHRTRYNRASD